MKLAPLPIDPVLPALIATLRQHGAVVLRAPTGSGKTTRVGPALLDAGLAEQGGIVMLEPRRVAARAAARRIAWEREGQLGGEIGYEVRFDRQVSHATRLRIVTDGILLRMLQDDAYLERTSVVIFDEFHERGLNADLALAMLRRVQQTVRPELKIVVMSATLDAGPLAAYLACPTLEAEGRSFPVQVAYAPPAAARSIPELAAQGTERALSESIGDVLVFLPGVGEIRRTAESLQPVASQLDLAIMPLYGDLPPEQQDAVLAPSKRRKVVLATNVAETSLTIEGISAVVDTGWARVLKFDPATGLDQLVLSRISRASAEQRAGRAGRTGPGVCLRLWSEREQQGLADQEEPEVRRVDLAAAALQLLCWGETDLEAFPWFEAPGNVPLDQACSLLRRLGAMNESGVTPLGRAMERFPVHPRLARLLLEGETLGVPDRAALAAALLSERDPIRRDQARGLGFGRPRVGHRSESDVLDRVAALEAFDRNGERNSDAGQIDAGAARFVLRARDQLLRLGSEGGRRSGGPGPGNRNRNAPAPDEALMRSLLAAYPDRVARRREPGTPRGLMVGGRGVRLSDQSAVLDAELFLCVNVDASGAGAESFVRLASTVERGWLNPDRLQVTDDVSFDAQQERVVATRRVAWEGLVLEQSAVQLPEGDEVARILAEAAAGALPQVLPKDDAISGFLARVAALRGWMPELKFPALDEELIRESLPALCAGRKSFAELRKAPWLEFLRGLLSYEQLQLLNREAPERLQVPTGSRIALQYEPGRPPILAVRIQEVFGLAETPRIAGGRVPVLLHLLGPNYRPQQVTDDLRSFWDNTYPQVRKDLRRRYPKHAWPEDPWNAVPVRKGPATRS